MLHLLAVTIAVPTSQHLLAATVAAGRSQQLVAVTVAVPTSQCLLAVTVAVGRLQKQVQMSEARAAAGEQAAAALQQDLANWQARFKRKDADLAAQTSKVITGLESQLRCAVCASTPRPQDALHQLFVFGPSSALSKSLCICCRHSPTQCSSACGVPLTTSPFCIRTCVSTCRLYFATFLLSKIGNVTSGLKP